MSGPGIFTRLQIARGRLERALDAFHAQAYLYAIGHATAPTHAELVQSEQVLERAYGEFRALAQKLTRTES